MNDHHDDDRLHDTVDAMLRAAPEPHSFDAAVRRVPSVPGPETIGIATTEEFDAAPARRPGRFGPARLAVALGVVVALVGGAWAFASLRSGDGGTAKVLTSPAAKALYAALGTSTGTGGYEVSYEFTIDRTSTELPCPTPNTEFATSGGTCSISGPKRTTVTGHGTVHLNPYFLETTSEVTGLGTITIRTDGNLIAEQGGVDYGKVEDGQPISGFAPAVQSTFGEGPGALTMLGLASPTGYLSLSADAVTDVQAAGTGTVDGVEVTYYNVTSDVDAMRDLPGLTDEQRTTIEQALDVLDRSGFEEATARIAVDGFGYIRESSSKATFADGTTMTRHMTLSKFGCIGTGPTPEHPEGTDLVLPSECETPPETSPTTIPATPADDGTPSTSVPASTTTTEPDTTTTAPEVGTTTTTLPIPVP